MICAPIITVLITQRGNFLLLSLMHWLGREINCICLTYLSFLWHTELNIFIPSARLKCSEFQALQDEALLSMMIFYSVDVFIFL